MLETKKYLKYSVLVVLALAFFVIADTIYKRVIYKDIMWYADDNNVSFNVAKYRLGIQGEIGDLGAYLLSNYKESFSGLYIQHQPTYSINILFKNLKDSKKTDKTWVQKSWGKFVKLHCVDFSLNELKAAQERVFELISELNSPNTVFFDIIKNRVVLYVLKEHGFEKALSVKGFKLPKEVTTVVVKEFDSFKLTEK